MLISTFFSENVKGARAEVVNRGNTFGVDFYDAAGNLLKQESYPDHNLRWAEDAAENWALGIKVLEG